MARRFIAVLVGFTDSVQRQPQAPGQDLGELRLAGAGFAVEQHVYPRLTAVQGAFQNPLHIIPLHGHVVEVLPLEIAFRCGVQEQAVHVTVVGSGCGGEAVQASRRLRVPVPVDAHQPGAHEGLVVGEATVHRVGRLAEQHGQARSLEVEDAAKPAAGKDVRDQALEHGLRLVAQQQFEDVHVRAGQADRCAESPQAPRRQVRAGASEGRVLALQHFLDAAPAARGQPLIGSGFPVIPAVAAIREHETVFAALQPLDQFGGLGVAVVETGGGVRQVKGGETSFVGVQHACAPF